MDSSKMLRLNYRDLIRGLVSAVFAAGFMSVGAVFFGVFHPTQGSFDLWSVDWVAVYKSTINAFIMGAEAGFSGYIGKNLFTDDQNRLFGTYKLP